MSRPEPCPKEIPIEDTDPFSPERLRLAPDSEAVGVRRVLTTVPIRKPTRQEFVWVHPGEEYRLEIGLLEMKEDGEYFLILPEMRMELADEMVFVRLHLTMSRGGAVFFWPIRLPDPDGRHNSWHASAMKGALLAMRQWTRLVSNKAMGGYDTFTAAAPLSEPEWPDLSMSELLRLAFGERTIASIDHPVVKRLRGQQ